MKRLIILVLVIFFGFGMPEEKPQITQITQINPYQKEYEKMLYPTVRITTPSGTGSGVIFNRKDAKRTIYILTAAHVVGNESKVTIELYPEEMKIDGSVVITDTEKDLALISVLCDFAVKPARLAPLDYTPYLFTPVWAVGCSLGLPPRPSYGHLCAFAVDNWEISAPVLPGNSGGPVYDARTFEVIGIAVWVKVYQYQLVTTMAGIVPIQQVWKFIEEYQKSNSKVQNDNAKPKN